MSLLVSFFILNENMDSMGFNNRPDKQKVGEFSPV